MTRDVRARRIDHEIEIHGRQVLFDQLLPELALHERVRRDHPDRCSLAPELKEPFRKWHSHRVAAKSGRIDRPVPLPQHCILHRDVRRIPDHSRVAPMQHIPRGCLVFERKLLPLPRRDARPHPISELQLLDVRIVQERIRHDEMQWQPRRFAQRRVSPLLQKRQRQPEPRDRHRVRIDVRAEHLVQRSPCGFANLDSRLRAQPVIQQPLERAEQEVPAASGRIDQRRVVEAEALDRAF
jgi:hypothetical protein